MTKYDMTIDYLRAPSDVVRIQNVQSIAWSTGRTLITDQLASGRCTITGRRPDLLPIFKIGETFLINLNDSYNTIVDFVVADFVIDYGIVSSMDTWTLTGEDAFALLGRWNGDLTFFAGDNTSAALGRLSAASGVAVQSHLIGVSIQPQSLSNVNGLTAATQIFSSEQPDYLKAGAEDVFWNPKGSVATPPSVYTATDSSPTASDWVYDVLEFDGIASDYVTKVNATSTGIGTESIGAGNRVYELSTYNASTYDLSAVAGLYAGYLSGSTVIPSRISLFAEAQTADPIIPSFTWSLTRPNYLTITFRTMAYSTIILGYSVTSTPDSTRVTYSLGPAILTSLFILDSATQGILGQTALYNTPISYNDPTYLYDNNVGNKLGF